MSPPIYTPDGSEVSEIVLPDGSTASEVIGPDGNVVFEAGPDIPDSVVDNFEDNDLSEWSNTGNVSITDTTILEGQYSLQITSGANSAGNRPYSLSGDGLDYYPQKGDRFSTFLWEGSGGNDELPAFCFGVATNTNGIDGYSVFHQPTFNGFGIQRIDDGEATILANPSVTLSTDQTYEYEIQWHDGSGSEPDDTIEVTIYETDESANLSAELGRSSQVVNTTVSDATYASNRGVGINNGSSNINGVNRVDRYWYLGDVE